MALSQALFNAIVDGKAGGVPVEAELKAGVDPMALIAETMIPAMDEVGKLFQEEEYFVPELMLSGRAMKAAMEPLRPLIAVAGAKPAGVIVAGTVKGDLHDIGKNLVVSMLEGAGFRGHRPRHRRFPAEVRRGDPRAQSPDRLSLRAADRHDDGDEDHNRGDRGGGP